MLTCRHYIVFWWEKKLYLFSYLITLLIEEDIYEHLILTYAVGEGGGAIIPPHLNLY